MEKNIKSSADIKNVLADTIQSIADMSVSAMKFSLENLSGSMGQVNKTMSGLGLGNLTIPFTQKSKHDCCAPEEECPPHCILQITKKAVAGERIMVPFMIKNSCNAPKTYRVGVRELKNIDGSTAPAQPELNKQQVTLDPGGSEMAILGLDLKSFPNGNTYTAEIVLREKEINQNICFKLIVDNNNNIPVAEPLDEKKYLLRWQSWKSHFYCEPKRGRLTATGINEG